MKGKTKLRRTILSAVLCIALVLVSVAIGFYCHHLLILRARARLPITTISLSEKEPLISVTSWRICGPFVTDAQDQHDSPSTETEMFAKDYLQTADAREAPLKLPSKITNVTINLQREPNSFNSTKSLGPGIFLNQTLTFPTADVDTKLLYWKAYGVFKVVYAAAELASPTDQDVILLAQTNSPIKIWINDRAQVQSDAGADISNPHVGVKVHLRTGMNTILVKLICFPLINNFSVWFATADGAHQFIEEHGGIFEASTQLVIPRSDPLRLASLTTAMYGGSIGSEGRYDIRDLTGRIVAAGSVAEVANAGINVAALPDGLYSLNVEKGAQTDGELFFVGDINKRIAMYSARCAAQASKDLPCDALPRLIKTNGGTEYRAANVAQVGPFQLSQQNIVIFIMAQFEWSLHKNAPTGFLSDDAPRVRLMSFRSHIDGSIQHYYLYLPPDAGSREPMPMVVVVPHNSTPELFPMPIVPLEKYARYAERYHLSFIAPFLRSKQMPSSLAEGDMLEAIQDAKTQFRVDDGRTYIGGDCAGGRSAFLMAEDYPEMFSAISTISADTGESAAVTYTRWDSLNVLLRLRNLTSMSIGLTHSQQDFHTPYSQTILLMQEAHKVGVFPQLTLPPDSRENDRIDPFRKMFEFLATAKRRDPAIPRHVTLAVTELKHNHMFWIRVDHLQRMSVPGYITADIGAQSHVNITSTNIREAVIDTAKMPPPFAGRRAWLVVCNGGHEQRLLPNRLGQIVINLQTNTQNQQLQHVGANDNAQHR
jgi:hypothetical protein